MFKKMMRPFLPLLLLLCPLMVAAQSVIGEWRDHFPYSKVITVAEGGGHIYAASATGLFRYDPGSGELERVNKTNLLNDIDIKGLAWNEQVQAMLVYYANGNLDLLQGDRSYNIGDIKRSSVIGNKGVYCAYMDGTRAYLGCGFGIVVIDLAAREVRETWLIGPSGSHVQVNGITMTADSIYAATQTGLFTASRHALNLSFFESWRRRSDMGPALAQGPFNAVADFGGRLLLNASRASGGDSLLLLGSDGAWSRSSFNDGRVNHALNITRDGRYVVIPHADDVHVYDTDMSEVDYASDVEGVRLVPQQAIRTASGALWVADRDKGLFRLGQGDILRVVPNGPQTAASWRMAAREGIVYVASGALSGTWDNTYLKDGVHMYSEGTWTTIDRSRFPLMNGVNEFGGALNDPIVVAVDPDDARHAFVGSWEEGLLEIRDGVPVMIYNASNSGLHEDLVDYQGKLCVSGLDYDDNGTLWICNAQSATPIVARTKQGGWYSFVPGSILGGNHVVADIVAASNGYKWMVRPRGNGLLVFDSGNSLQSTDDDRYKLLNTQEGSGGLPSPDVFSIAEDQDGQIWVGTGRGIAVFYNPWAAFSDGDFDARQILIEQDGNVQILLETEAISTIAVDGANRKWIGTQGSGVYLISPDGQEQIHHFSAENSPLPSNTIVNIAVDGSTGEVYIATDRGIMSYRSDATEGGDRSDCAKVFPNPVRETYTGPIAITGLVANSEVKITDVSGNIVHRTRSLGGQAIWDGNDMSGRRAATGVYLLFASDIYGTFKCNTKLLLVK